MKAKINDQYQAKYLRAKGYSIKEIAAKLGVSQGSVSLWVRNIKLSNQAKLRLLKRIHLCQYMAAEKRKEKTRDLEEKYLKEAKNIINTTLINNDCKKIICAAIYWCEGVKNVQHGVTFVNSDPDLIKTYLKLLYSSFSIKKEKFKPLLHLHSYHDSTKEIDFWSKVINIDKSQFKKPYIKFSDHKRIRKDYHGCLSLRYFDSDLARQLLSLGRAFIGKGV